MRSWYGCHGVAVGPGTLGAPYGSMSVEPLGELHVSLVHEDPRDQIALRDGAVQLWSATNPADRLTQQDYWVNPDGSTVVRLCGKGVLALDTSRGHVLVGDIAPGVALHLIATFAVAPAAQAWGALVMHACAVERDGKAVLICAESGVGKSSMLVALSEAGWAPITEDLCAIDVAPVAPLAWPGPPWVRMSPTNPAPSGWAERFRTRDKITWDLGANRTTEPVPLAHIVLLDRPASDTDVPTQIAPIRPVELVPALADHAPWFDAPHLRPSGLFGPTAALAASVPATRVRLQQSRTWQTEGVDLVEKLMSASG